MNILEVPLTKGKVARIDEADYPLISQYRWHTHFTSSGRLYAASSQKKRNLYLHRLLMDAPNGVMVDHIDNDGLNCTRENMRLATNAQNQQRVRHGNDGVKWNPEKARWIAMVRVGSFRTRAEAVTASLAARKLLYGEFAPQDEEQPR